MTNLNQWEAITNEEPLALESHLLKLDIMLNLKSYFYLFSKSKQRFSLACFALTS